MGFNSEFKGLNTHREIILKTAYANSPKSWTRFCSRSQQSLSS